MSDMEEEFLLAVERGQVERLRQLLSANEYGQLDVNCRDPLDRDALIIAIDSENLDIIRMLLETDIRVGEALLYAIQNNFVEAVELLLDHAGQQGGAGTANWEQSCFFSCDMTPLMLAAQKNNLEIIKLLLDRKVSPIPNPHDPRCGCAACQRARSSDCLRHSRSRINAYKALSSPSLMALSSGDPLAAAFEMSARLEDLGRLEPEYKADYMRLRAQCQTFATKLLDYARTSEELEILLNYEGRESGAGGGGDGGAPCAAPGRNGEPGRASRSRGARLARLKLAIQCKQKTFCAHPNIQELLATMWYENLPGFRRRGVFCQTLQVLCIGLLFPLYSLAYLIAPRSKLGSYIRKPFIKFICHSASYITFIIVLILASQRVEAFYRWSTVMSLFFNTDQGSWAEEAGRELLQQQQQQQQQAGDNFTLWRATIGSPPTSGYSDDSDINKLAALYRHTMGQAGAGGTSTARGLDSLSKIFEELPASSKKRGTLPSPIEVVILVWVLSLIWAELKQIRLLGINYYKDDMWNILDSTASGCYIGTIILRTVSYLESDDKSLEVAREHWHAYDPTLLSEGLFATATIFSALRLVYIFSVNPYLGPLQISLGRMIVDILRFSWIYMLVLFAFACGMNQLLWYYADLERHQCLNVTNYNLAQYYKAKHNLVELAPGPAAPGANSSGPAAPGANSSGPAAPGFNSSGPANAAKAANANGSANGTGREQDFANMTDEGLMESAFSASLEDDSSMPPVTIDDSCKTWRHFSNVFESSQTLFWANFGLVDLENFDLTGIRQYTRFWALLMFGCYCFINVIVVLNLLIAMMNHSYVKISKRSDVEWKFARTRLWVSYFENGSTVPAPFNIIPSLKSIGYCLGSIWRRLGRLAACCRLATEAPAARAGAANGGHASANAKSVHLNRLRQSENETKLVGSQPSAMRSRLRPPPPPPPPAGRGPGPELNYDLVIRALVRRYLVGEQRLLEKRSGLTEAKLKRWSRLNVFT